MRALIAKTTRPSGVLERACVRRLRVDAVADGEMAQHAALLRVRRRRARLEDAAQAGIDVLDEVRRPVSYTDPDAHRRMLRRSVTGLTEAQTIPRQALDFSELLAACVHSNATALALDPQLTCGDLRSSRRRATAPGDER